MKKTIFWAVGIVLVVVVFVFAVRYFVFYSNEETAIKNIPSWERLADQVKGITFQYPKTIGTKYITPVAWPPQDYRWSFCL